MQSESPARVGRPPDRREGVVNALRERIVSGHLKPGDRLPTHHELEEHFQAGPPAVQAAMALLREHGFIETKHRCGSFVAAHPPHLSHFALAFPFPVLKGHSHFYEAIRDEAAKLQADERRVSAFYGIESHVDVDDYQRLLGLMQAHRLAGLIFAGSPHALRMNGSPLVLKPGVRRIAIMEAMGGPLPFPTVYPDIRAFLPRAFDYLASRGRKRVAVVTLNTGNMGGYVTDEKTQALAAERGLIVRPHWLQGVVPGLLEWQRKTALLLLHERQTEPLDALVITDDNLVEGITEGVLASGARGARLEVVAQANFPYPTRSAVPAKRLGFDITRLMVVCLERIERQRRGEDVPAHTAIPAVFEEELGQAAGGKGERNE
jgi:DNA-binding LacI/PurR family transcriptional regulator